MFAHALFPLAIFPGAIFFPDLPLTPPVIPPTGTPPGSSGGGGGRRQRDLGWPKPRPVRLPSSDDEAIAALIALIMADE